MTSRFRALLRTAMLYALLGVPAGLVDAMAAAWSAPQGLRDGIGFWSLTIGFAFDSVRMFMIIFGLVGLVFGLWLSVAGLPVHRRHAAVRGTLLGALAGMLSGLVAYAFAGWGAGESAIAWITGASSLAALSALVGAGTAGAAYMVAGRVRTKIAAGHPPVPPFGMTG